MSKRALFMVAVALHAGCDRPAPTPSSPGSGPQPVTAGSGSAVHGSSVTIAGEAVEVLPAGAEPARDGFYLDESRSAKSPNYAKLLAYESDGRPPGTDPVRTFVQVYQDGGVTYAYAACGTPSMTLWITDRQLRVRYWEPQDYGLDRVKFGPGGFQLSISEAAMHASRHPDWVPQGPLVAGNIVASEPTLYEIDLWGRSSVLAVELGELARLPLVIHRCIAGKRVDLSWTR